MACKYDGWWEWPMDDPGSYVSPRGPVVDFYGMLRPAVAAPCGCGRCPSAPGPSPAWDTYLRDLRAKAQPFPVLELSDSTERLNPEDLERLLADADLETGRSSGWTIKAAQASCLQGANEHIQWINNNKEQLLSAWIADTGIAPQDSVMVMQEHWEGPKMIRRVWIEKKTNE